MLCADIPVSALNSGLLPLAHFTAIIPNKIAVELWLGHT